MNLEKGYIRLFRQFLDWEWYDNPTTKVLFIHLLLNANSKPKKWQGIDIKRGQLVTSVSKLAVATKLSIQQIKTAIKNLQKTNEIEIQTTSRYSIISIKKYNLYQADNKQPTRSLTNKQQAENGTITSFWRTSNPRVTSQITTTNNSIDISNIYNNLSSSIEKNKENEISDDEREILKNYVKQKGLAKRNLRGYVHTMIENGSYTDILKEEKARLERLKQKENIPPPEKEPEETPEEIEKARTEAHAKVLQLKNPKRKKG